MRLCAGGATRFTLGTRLHARRPLAAGRWPQPPPCLSALSQSLSKPLTNGGLPRCKANVSGKGAGLQRMGLGFICGAQSRQGSNWLHAAPCTRCMRGRGGCSPGSRSSCAAAPPRWRSARTRPPPGARRPALLRLRQSPRALGAETKWLHLHTAHSSWRTAGVTADLHQRAARHASPCIWPWAGQ